MRGKGLDTEALDDAVNRATRSRTDALQPLQERSRSSVFDRGFVARLMVGKYQSTIDGVPFLKDAVSQHVYQELINKVKPRTVIDLGTAFGGSAMWFAQRTPAVHTFDIDDVRKRPLPSNVTFHRVDICDTAAVYTALQDAPHPWLVCEDCHLSTHTIMSVFDPIMRPGDYIVFEDTHPCNPDEAGMSAESDTYSCDTWATAKLDSVETEMYTQPQYLIDTDLQDLYGYNGCTHINSIFCKV